MAQTAAERVTGAAVGAGQAIVEVAPAKLNLALHVRRRRADGYHDIETLFAFCRDGDAVSVAHAEHDAFVVTGPFAAALAGEGDNLVTRAAHAFTGAFASGTRHAITLDKRLPVASGLGGGSADAAATLRALARLHDVAADTAPLVAIARQLGADVPACLAGRTAVGTGRGDELVDLGGVTGRPVLLVNPGVAVSTAAVFAGWNGQDRGPIGKGDVLARAATGRNDLAPAAIAVAPVIADVLARLEAQSGVALVRMSGSGATCFALFADAASRDRAAATMKVERPGWWQLATMLA